MSPLHLRFFPSFRLRFGGKQLCLVIAVGAAAAGGAMAQDPPQNGPAPARVDPGAIALPVQTIKFRERPRYVTDPQRLRRTPVIDGVLTDGEWDPFYTIDDGPIKGTVYCNWDDHNLYLAAKTDSPATVLFDVDAGGDGWLRGADNMEIVVGPAAVAGGAPTVTARLLDAANSKDTPSWNETAIDPKTLIVAEKSVGGTQFLELAIPRNTGSLVLRPGATMGVRAEFLPPGPATAYVPTQPFEPHLLLDATLVEQRVTSAQGLNPKLTLSYYKCVPGQKLFGTLELFNQTDIPVKIKSVLWSGEGSSANAVNTLREVNVPPALGLKRYKRHYETVLPENLSVGSYMLSVAIETEDGKHIESAAAFSVVEAVQAQMSTEPQPVAILGPTRLVAKVDVQSAVPDHFQGDVELLNYPAGWEVTNGKKHGLHIDHQDHHGISGFDFKLPSNTPAGQYPLEAAVSWHGKVWKVHCTAQVVRSDAPVKAQPAPQQQDTGTQ